MNNLHVLPLLKPPYHNMSSFTDSLAILYANDHLNAENWVLSHCLSLAYQKMSVNGNSYFMNIVPTSPYKVCVLSSIRSAPHFLINVEVAKTAILNGYYILAMVDGYFIKNHVGVYNNFHKPHELLLYGFDDQQKKFYAADYFYKPNCLPEYKFDMVDYDDWISSLNSIEKHYIDGDYVGGVKLIKYNNINFNLDLNLIKYCIEKHLESKIPNRILENYDREPIYVQPMIVGLKAYDEFMNEVVLSEKNIRIVLRAVQGIYMHSCVVFDSIRKSLEKDVGKEIEDLIEKAYEYVRKCEQIRSVLMRNYVKGTSTSQNIFIDNIKTIRNTEEILMTKWYEMLKY